MTRALRCHHNINSWVMALMLHVHCDWCGECLKNRHAARCLDSLGAPPPEVYYGSEVNDYDG